MLEAEHHVKIGMLTVVIVSATYLITGVTRYTNQISSLENAAAAGHITEADKLTQIHTMLKGAPGLPVLRSLCPAGVPYAVMGLKSTSVRKSTHILICSSVRVWFAAFGLGDIVNSIKYPL